MKFKKLLNFSDKNVFNNRHLNIFNYRQHLIIQDLKTFLKVFVVFFNFFFKKIKKKLFIIFYKQKIIKKQLLFIMIFSKKNKFIRNLFFLFKQTLQSWIIEWDEDIFFEIFRLLKNKTTHFYPFFFITPEVILEKNFNHLFFLIKIYPIFFFYKNENVFLYKYKNIFLNNNNIFPILIQNKNYFELLVLYEFIFMLIKKLI